MLRARTARLVGTALLAVAAPAMAADALKVTPPKLEVREHKLANGLDLLMYEDHSVPVATVQVWYHVGSKDEKKGRSGFAHLFEHLMFKGSANVGPEEHKNFIASIGGRYNATTDFDRTLYFQAFPSNYLERVLWMEADRMRSLDVSEENFKSERDVVKEERRLRVDNPPFGRLFEVVLDKTFTTHPYRIHLHRQHGRPRRRHDRGRARLPPPLLRAQQRHAGGRGRLRPGAGDTAGSRSTSAPSPRGKPIPREIPQEPAQTAERRAVDYDAEHAAAGGGDHLPRAREAGQPDTYALQVASNILSSGESSRLYRGWSTRSRWPSPPAATRSSSRTPGSSSSTRILQRGKPRGGREGADRRRPSSLQHAAGVRRRSSSRRRTSSSRRSSSAARPARQGRRDRLRRGHPRRRVVLSTASSPNSRRSPPRTSSGWRAPISAPRTARWSTCCPRPCAKSEVKKP